MEHSAPQGYVRGTGRYHQPYPSALYILCICLLLYLYLCICTCVFVFVMTSEQEDCVGLIHIHIHRPYPYPCFPSSSALYCALGSGRSAELTPETFRSGAMLGFCIFNEKHITQDSYTNIQTTGLVNRPHVQSKYSPTPG